MREGIIQNEEIPTINVTLDVDNDNCEVMMLITIVMITMVFMIRMGIKIC